MYRVLRRCRCCGDNEALMAEREWQENAAAPYTTEPCVKPRPIALSKPSSGNNGGLRSRACMCGLRGRLKYVSVAGFVHGCKCAGIVAQ
jgi:hypothetical protein